MLRLAVILWALVGTTLAGSFILAVVSIPSLSDQGMRLIPWAVAVGFTLAIPAAAILARGIVRGPQTA